MKAIQALLKAFKIYSTITLLIAMFSLFLFLVLVVNQSLNASKPVNVDVDQLVRNAGRVLVIRFPESSLVSQEEIILFDDGKLIRGSVADIRGRATTANISPEVLSQVHNLLDELCQNNVPGNDFHTNSSFAVGIQCSKDYSRAIRIDFTIESLPDEFAFLIDALDSPSCSDKWCGWKAEAHL